MVPLGPQMEEYEEGLKIANCSKQQELKSQMMAAVRERVFYLTTLKHHAGIIDCFLLGIAYHYNNYYFHHYNIVIT